MDYRPPGSSVHRIFQARVLKWVAMNIQKTKIMASGPITSWEIDGETVETVRDFTYLGSKITAHKLSGPRSAGADVELHSGGRTDSKQTVKQMRHSQCAEHWRE